MHTGSTKEKAITVSHTGLVSQSEGGVGTYTVRNVDGKVSIRAKTRVLRSNSGCCACGTSM
jgi:hypothetical protein